MIKKQKTGNDPLETRGLSRLVVRGFLLVIPGLLLRLRDESPLLIFLGHSRLKNTG